MPAEIIMPGRPTRAYMGMGTGSYGDAPDKAMQLKAFVLHDTS